MAKIDYKDFVVDWTTSRTLNDVMRASGLSRDKIRYHEKALRKAGVDLPYLKFDGRDLGRAEVSELNSLIRKHTPKAT